jgi:hypothetical protein
MPKKTAKQPSVLSRRRTLIRALEAARGSRVITYVTSTRQNLEVPMALDVIRLMYDHLEEIRKSHKGAGKPKIDLFLHSNGGDGTVPWRLVTLFREYTDQLGVLVPHRAFSAATLTALGADEIVMHPMGMLGPTDPTVQNAFNPVDARGQRLGISVEDVTAYIQLVKEDAGIQHEDELVQAFNILASQVHPLALGNVKRLISQSRMMATKLLELHMPREQAHAVDEIVEKLTSKLFYHGHPINRVEASEQIGLKKVVIPPAAIDALMWDLYLEYEKELILAQQFDSMAEFTAQHDPIAMAVDAMNTTAPTKHGLACIDSLAIGHICEQSYYLSGTKQKNGSVAVGYFRLSGQWSRR